MRWIPTVSMLIVIVLLTIQGIILFRQGAEKRIKCDSYRIVCHKKYTRFAGILNFILALFALAAYFLFANGTLILSPEYSILLAQGTASWLWTLATLMTVSIAFGVVLHAMRCAKNLPDHRGELIIAGFVIGSVSALRTRTLPPVSPLESGSLLIRYFDLWSFFFLAWIITILTLSFLTALQPRKKEVPRFRRFAAPTIVLACFGLLATHRSASGFVYADPWTLPLWTATTLVGVPAVMAAITWRVFRKQVSSAASKIAPISFSVVAALVGLLVTGLWMVGPQTSAVPTLAICTGVWATWAIALALVAVLRWHRRTGQCQPATIDSAGQQPSGGNIKSLVRHAWQYLPDVGFRGRSDDAVALAGLTAMVIIIADICHSARVDPIWDLAALIASWVGVSEIISGYPLWHVHIDFLRKIASIETPMSAPGKKLSASLSFVFKPLRYLFGPQSPAGTILKLVSIFIALVVVGEIPNAGKTIVESFTSTEVSATEKGDKDSDKEISKDLGRLVSERVVNTIGMVGQEIRPDLVLLDEKGKGATWLPVSGSEASNVQAALASTSFEIPGTKISIPLGFVISPIQKPLRWLLGVRVIHGSVQKDGNRYVLLANSSTGQTWQVSYAVHQSTGDPRPPNPPKGSAIPLPSAEGRANEATSGEAIVELADTLAYQVISSDMKLKDMGIGSAVALPDFREGVAQWKKFQISQGGDALDKAEQCFRQATEKDPDFALAYYRLGQAYLSDGQPRAAADSFRESVRANPKFVAGHIALTDTLYYLNWYYHDPPAAVSRRGWTGHMGERDADEAWGEMEQLLNQQGSYLTVPRRAAAYFGLCRMVYPGKNRLRPYDVFFYCRRAEYLYSRLPTVIRSNPGIKDRETTVLYWLGNILQKSSDASVKIRDQHEDKKDLWLCDPEATRTPVTRYLQAAGRYYRLALEKQPNDVVIRCSDATVSLALKPREGKEKMEMLRRDKAAHLQLAVRLIKEARTDNQNEPKKVASQYEAAWRETTEAIHLAPYDPQALNLHAYYAWEWYWAWVRRESDTIPRIETLEEAEDSAREATRLTEDKGLHVNHGTNQSTLGEIRLALGKSDEALKTLREIFEPEGRKGHPDVGSQAFFDEVRWDFAQACVCASSKKWSSKQRYKWAKEQLEAIRQHESRRLDHRFSGQLKLKELRNNCQEFKKEIRWLTSMRKPSPE